MNNKRVMEIAKAMFKADHTVKEVAEELNLSMSHTMKLKKDLGLTRPKRNPRDDAEKMIEMRDQGYTNAEIAETLGWSVGTITCVLRESGYGRFPEEDLSAVLAGVVPPKREDKHQVIDGVGYTDITDRILNLEGDSIWST